MNGAQNEQQQGTYEDAQINQGSGDSSQGQQRMYHTGYGNQPKPNFNRKSPLVAALLSCMPGLGQIYVGYYQQGFINMFVVAGTIATLASSFMQGAEPFFGVFLSFFWIFQMIDANRRAHHYNRVMAGLGGGVLVILGILFIMDLNFDVSMQWVENWWPLILVLVGVNLIFKARKNAD